ncbi:DUF1206 domain-containing protein [Nakamurella endophytica]|uniref:DUF1206 domain-containing protein n=1 Tax=Nakamurella endophytica TaxID=1748367 RepID=A0A917T1P7_9ACTN|nr:DUF1206 domain-containing protein [Nakamurella endophytica]GGM07153.1 hypothetical protein GCM10011594_28960 [Nakamurella endophytica]
MTAGGTAGRMGRAARDAGRQAEDAGRDVQGAPWFGTLVMVGLVAYGVVHLVVAWLALQLAFTGTGQETSQQGAMAELASTAVGKVLLWVIALGLVALTVWQALVAAMGYRDESGSTKVQRRLSAAAKAVVYAALAVSAVTTLTGSASAGAGDRKEKGWTARLLSVSFGRVLVAAVAVAILAVAARLVYRGVTTKFTHDLRTRPPAAALRLGQVGYVAKGVAFAVVGILVGWAAVTLDPDKAGGLDTALRTLRGQPYGVVLLVVIALGIACFGLYCFYWARHAKR